MYRTLTRFERSTLESDTDHPGKPTEAGMMRQHDDTSSSGREPIGPFLTFSGGFPIATMALFWTCPFLPGLHRSNDSKGEEHDEP